MVTTNPIAKLEQVHAILGRPSFHSHGVSLYHVDALQAMEYLPSSLVDLTVTSPPYNIGKEYETTIPLADYLDWSEQWIRQVHRLSSPFGAFWLNLGYVEVPGRGRAVPIAYLLWERLPFYLLQEVVWNYGAGVATKQMFSPRNEKFLWLVKSLDHYTFNLDDVRDPNVKYPGQRKNGRLRVNQLGKNPTDVWQIPKVTTGQEMTGRRASPERTKHPAQFPVAVIERIVRSCSNPGHLLLDPFMGSCTTAEVAIRNGRSAIGFEIKQEYLDIGIGRLERVIRTMEIERAQGRLL